MSLVYCVVECQAAQSRWNETERQRQQFKKKKIQQIGVLFPILGSESTQASATEMHPVGLKK